MTINRRVADMHYATIDEVTSEGASARRSQEPDDVSPIMSVAHGVAQVGGKAVIVDFHGSSFLIPISESPAAGGAGLHIKSVVADMAALHALAGAKDGDVHLVRATGDLYVSSGGVWHDLGHIVGPPGPAGPSAVSIDAGNSLILGSDHLLYQSEAQIFEQAGTNLWYNGYGFMGSNVNFSAFAYSPTEVRAGKGGFIATGKGIAWSRPVAVDTTKSYDMCGWQKNLAAGHGNHSFNISQYDADGLAISPWQGLNQMKATETTLAKPYHVGDATVTLTDATGWTVGDKGFLFYPYTSPSGITYPTYGYSRNAMINRYTISGNVLTLASSSYRSMPRNPATSDGSWPAGTPVVETFSSGSYIYPWSASTTNTDWEHHCGTVGPEGSDAALRWWHGTATMKLGIMPQHRAGDIDKSAWSGLSFRMAGDAVTLAALEARVVALEAQVHGQP